MVVSKPSTCLPVGFYCNWGNFLFTEKQFSVAVPSSTLHEQFQKTATMILVTLIIFYHESSGEALNILSYFVIFCLILSTENYFQLILAFANFCVISWTKVGPRAPFSAFIWNFMCQAQQFLPMAVHWGGSQGESVDLAPGRKFRGCSVMLQGGVLKLWSEITL